MRKRLFSLLLALCLIAGLVPLAAAPALADWNTDYDLDGYTEAGKLITVAMAQNGKRRADLSYTTAWCAYFIRDCAKRAGVDYAVGSNGGYAYQVRDYVINKGGYKVSYEEAAPGDIVTIDWSKGTGVDHVEIVYQVDGGVVYTVGGNYTKPYSDGQVHIRNKSESTYLKPYISGIYRPAYSDSGTHTHYYNSYGVCSCGDYSFYSDSASVNSYQAYASPETYELTKEAPIRVGPYQECKSTTYAAGTQVSDLGELVNAKNNKWYYLSDGRYIFSGNVKKAAGGQPDPTPVVTMIPTDDSTYKAKEFISETNACVVTKIIKKSGSSITRSGIALYDASGNTIKDYWHSVTNVPASQTTFHSWYEFNNEVGVTLAPATTYQYRFHVTVDGGDYYSDTYSFTTSGSIPTYTISFDANGGTEAPPAQSARSGETIYISSVTPARNGYSFMGWASGSGASAPEYYPGSAYTVTGSITLYAVWQKTDDSLKISYSPDCSDYTGAVPADQSVKAGEIVALSDGGSLARSGYRLLGWSRTSGATEAEFDLGAKVNIKLTSDITLYAVWQESTAPAGTEIHFEQQTIYFQGQFTDVPANQWFTPSVASAFELGLMKGKSKTTFQPYGDVTIAEAITIAARIHSIYTTGTENFVQAGMWYQVYLDYAYEYGIISRAYYNCDVSQKATRAQFAEILAKSLPDEALYAMNSVADNAIPDVKLSDSYASYVYKLYRAGILTGSDANGTFNPKTFITRAESAAVVSRMAESSNRVSITLG